MLQLIILLHMFNAVMWLTGLAKVVSTCSGQPKLITKVMTCTIFYIFSGYCDAMGARSIKAVIVMHVIITCLPLVNYRCEGGVGEGNVA